MVKLNKFTLRQRYRYQAGFTLIELMLSSALLMMVMFSGYYAYSVYSNKWEKRTNEFWVNTQSALAFDSMNRTIESTYPYIVQSTSNSPAIYFIAGETYLRFATHSAIFTSDVAMVELEIKPEEDKYLIVYREASINDSLILRQSDRIQWQYQIVLIDDLEAAKFTYFGWQGLEQVLQNVHRDFESREGQRVDEISASWYQEHKMELRRILPVKVRIEFESSDGKYSNFDVLLPENGFENLIRYLREDF